MHDRPTIGKVPAEITLRDLPCGITAHLTGRIACALRTNITGLLDMFIEDITQELLNDQLQLMARELFGEIVNMPVGGFDDPRDNRNGAQLMADLAGKPVLKLNMEQGRMIKL